MGSDLGTVVSVAGTSTEKIPTKLDRIYVFEHHRDETPGARLIGCVYLLASIFLPMIDPDSRKSVVLC